MRRIPFTVVGAIGLAALVLTGCTPSDGTAGTEPRFAHDDCNDLLGLAIDAADIGLPTTGAEVTRALWVGNNGGQCRVNGTISPVESGAPVIQFQVNLPAVWNGRMVQFGGGGYNGALVTGLDDSAFRSDGASAATALDDGYVTLGSDSGHVAAEQNIMATSVEALANYGRDSLKKTHDVAIALMEALYEEGPEYSYFLGFSTGGGEALEAAGLWPDDYDGVVGGTPAYNVAMLHAGVGSLYRDALYSDGGSGWIDPAKTRLVVTAVYDTCDGLDGLEDGVISDPEGCGEVFDVTRLRCPDGSDAGDTCLSDAQIAAADRIAEGTDIGFEIAGNSYAAGGPLYVGGTYDVFTLGSEPQPHSPLAGTEAFYFTVMDLIAKNIITDDAAFDVVNWDIQADRERIQEVGEYIDGTDVDYSAAQAAGTKILLWTGWADDGISPFNTIQLYERQVEQFGDGLDEFFRFYTAPGYSHGFGPFNARWNQLDAIVGWVERGEVPEVTLVDVNPDAEGRTRPMCEYPSWPKYTGSDEGDAASFTCVDE